MSNFELIITVLVAGGLLGFAALFITTAWLEKQPLHDMVPGPLELATGDSPYFVAMNEAAQRLGFTPAGVFVQNRKSRVYQAILALWISPDGQTLMRIGGGKTAGVAIKRTVLSSLFEPDRIIETSDEVASSDLSGTTERKFYLNAGLDELVARHQERLAAWPGAKRIFSAAAAHAEYEAMQSLKATRMVRLGLGKFLNPEQTVWRHTFKGAWQQLFKGFRSQMAEGRAQRERINLKRPGST